MAYIPEEVISEIAGRADLAELVMGYVPDLKRAGSRWKACCPFHHEKTPSFIVSPDSNTFHCFGCGAGGDVFKFVMLAENLDFPNAVRMLARKYSVLIPDPEPYRGKPVRTRYGDSNYNLRERLFLLHDRLADWYAAELKNNPDSPAAAYFRSRAIEPNAAVRFRLGAAPDRWDAMMNRALNAGFTLEELKAAHLVSESRKTPGKYFDFFRNRLMFPIWNEQGRVAGFSARQINPEQGGGKYVNSMESPIFKKGRLLYGLNFARLDIPKKGCVILCEGQMDVIAMHSAGCTNAVAPQGTAFGDDQAALLHRYTDTVILATDADNAGFQALLKDAAILLPHGFHLKTVAFSGGKDPDELLHHAGPDAVRQAVESAQDFFAFLFAHYSQEYDSATPDGKVRTASEVIRYLRLLDSPMAQDSYLNWLAEKLNLTPESLESELKKQTEMLRRPRRTEHAPRRETADNVPATGAPLPGSMTDPQLKVALSALFRTILHYRPGAGKTAAELLPDYLDDGPVARAVAVLIQAHLNEQWDGAPAQIGRELAACRFDCSEVYAILAEDAPDAPDGKIALKIVEDCLRRIRQKYLQKQLSRLRARLAKKPPDEARKTLLREFTDISRRLNKL